MRSALYYPHTEIRTEAVWKSALLMWDEIHTIVPWQDFRPQYADLRFAEAFELIGVPHCPDDEEKARAHEVIEDFATRPLPHAFSFDYSSASNAEPYELYPEKFYPHTWDLLRDAGLAGSRLEDGDFPTAQPTGLSLMSILADSCAGSSLARVTDRTEAYASLSGLFVANPCPWRDGPTPPSPELLIPVALKTVNLNEISLDRLLDLRRREKTAREGKEIRRLRHKFLEHLEKQADSLKSAKTKRDFEQKTKEFSEDVETDFRDLKEALKLRYVDAITTKEIITTMVAATGSAVTLAAMSIGGLQQAAAAVGVGTLGGVVATAAKMFSLRKKLLLDHPTAYLYELQGGIRW